MRSAIFLSVVFSLLFVSCGKEEINFEAFSPEAFAYNIGEGWEVVATTRVKGFTQEEVNGTFSTSVVMEVDIVKPDGDTVKSLVSKVFEESAEEKIMDFGIEAQFELPADYPEGTYTIIFNVTDPASMKKTVSQAEFQLAN